MAKLSIPTYLSNLTDAQQLAAMHGDGPALVVAGPGSGKTRCLTHRIAHLVRTGTKPGSILAVTFTNKAADEMKTRLVDLVGKKAASQLWVSTFHSFCARILRQHSVLFGIHRHFSICDEKDAEKYIEQAMAAVGDHKGRVSYGVESVMYVRKRISRIKQQLHTSEEWLQRLSDNQGINSDELYIGKCYSRYHQKLRRSNTLDFDDLQLYAARGLKKDKEALHAVASCFNYLLVDEYQDTNFAQFVLVKQLVLPHGNVFVIGDPSQCFPGSVEVHTTTGPKQIRYVREGERVLCASGHGTTAIGVVEKVFKRPYDDTVITITTERGTIIRATPEHCFFASYKTSADRYYVYLMYSNRLGYRIGLASPYRTSSQGYMIPGFIGRLAQEGGDAVWVLKTCQDRSEASFWESFLSTKYGIPTTCYYVGGRSLSMTQEQIDRLFTGIDTASRAESLINDLELSLQHPHFTPQNKEHGQFSRQAVTLRMFGGQVYNTPNSAEDGEGTWYSHECSFHCMSKQTVQAIPKDISVGKYKNRFWRARKTSGSYMAIEHYANRIANAVGGSVIHKARIFKGRNTCLFMPAFNLLEGMTIPILSKSGDSIEEDIIVDIRRERYKGFVYDLSIPHYRNYCVGNGGSGVAVHNSIYGFRGANVGNILSFRNTYKDAKVYYLEKNFRSLPAICCITNIVLQNSNDNFGSNIIPVREGGEAPRCLKFRDKEQEARIVCDEITTAIKRKRSRYKDFAILYRTRAQSRAFEEVMIKQNIPYRVVGSLGFYQRAVIKNMLAYMKLMVNMKDDVSFTRIYNTPPRRIGTSTFQEFCGIQAEHDCSMMEVLRYKYYTGRLTGSGSIAIARLRSLFTKLRKLPKKKVADVVLSILHETGYKLYLEKSKNEIHHRQAEELDELVAAAIHFDAVEGKGLRGFLEWATLAQGDPDEEYEKKNKVLLMTCHAAKGLEFKNVYLVGASDRKHPLIWFKDDKGQKKSKKEIQKDVQEERRVFYVAVSRAEDTLTISHHTFDHEGEQRRSRFINELGDALVYHDHSQTVHNDISMSLDFSHIEEFDHDEPSYNERSQRTGTRTSRAAHIQHKRRERKSPKGGRTTEQSDLWS